MKKILIGSLIGAVLLFGWQAMSWTMMGIHDKAYLHTPAQDTLLSTITNTLKTEGQYMLPRVPDGASAEQMEALGKKMNGNPWAVVTYHKSYTYDMMTPVIRGFFIALVCVILVSWIIQRLAKKTFGAVYHRFNLWYDLFSFCMVQSA